MSSKTNVDDQITAVIKELQLKLNENGKSAAILNREWLPAKSSTSTTLSHGLRVRVMQWNILAQGLCPISNFFYCSRETLVYPRRFYMIMWELLRHQADIMCLEEADLYPQIMAFFQQHNLPFLGVFYAKHNSACLSYADNYGPDGCAVIYRSDRFQCVSTEVVHLCDGLESPVKGVTGTQLALFVQLHSIHTNSETQTESIHSKEASLLVVCTHLKASSEFYQLRSLQGDMILNALQQRLTSNVSQNIQNCGVFVCGDFNADPDESVISKFTQSPLKLQSLYKEMHALDCGIDEEPPFTTWKTRFIGQRGSQPPSDADVAASGGKLLLEACHTIDYIWYGAGATVQPTAFLHLPSKEQIGPQGLPCDTFPSDHLSLVAEFHVGVDKS